MWKNLSFLMLLVLTYFCIEMPAFSSVPEGGARIGFYNVMNQDIIHHGNVDFKKYTAPYNVVYCGNFKVNGSYDDKSWIIFISMVQFLMYLYTSFHLTVGM